MRDLIRDIGVCHDTGCEKGYSDSDVVSCFGFFSQEKHTRDEDNDYIQALPDGVDDGNLTTAMSQSKAEDDTNSGINHTACKKLPIVGFVTLRFRRQQNFGR